MHRLSTKTCGCCRQLLPLSDFAWRRKARGQLDNYCRACRAAYKQEHYSVHRERYVANAGRRKQALIAERTAYLLELFRERPCVDCGETDPLVLEFDHLGRKNFNISTGLRDRNWHPCSTRSPPATWFVQTVIVGEPLFGVDSPARW